MATNLVTAKVSVFTARSYKLHPSLLKGSTWHFIETKSIKHDYYCSLIMWTLKNSRGKYWVVSQQALFFNDFLARHDDSQ